MGWLGEGNALSAPEQNQRYDGMILEYGKVRRLKSARSKGVGWDVRVALCFEYRIFENLQYCTVPTQSGKKHRTPRRHTDSNYYDTARYSKKTSTKVFRVRVYIRPPPIKARLKGPRNNHLDYDNPKQEHPTSKHQEQILYRPTVCQAGCLHEPNPYSTPSTPSPPVSHTSKSSHHLQTP